MTKVRRATFPERIDYVLELLAEIKSDCEAITSDDGLTGDLRGLWQNAAQDLHYGAARIGTAITNIENFIREARAGALLLQRLDAESAPSEGTRP